MKNYEEIESKLREKERKRKKKKKMKVSGKSVFKLKKIIEKKHRKKR